MKLDLNKAQVGVVIMALEHFAVHLEENPSYGKVIEGALEWVPSVKSWPEIIRGVSDTVRSS
jgi:hypothetical protein